MIIPSNRGFYCWMNPDLDSILRLGSIRNKEHPSLKHYNSTRLHVTVIYSHTCPSRVLIPKAKLYQSTVESYELWDDGNKFLLVGKLNSRDIEALHRLYTSLGAVHTFDPYSPHITLGEFSTDSADVQEYIYALNRTNSGVQISFGPQVFIDSLKE